MQTRGKKILSGVKTSFFCPSQYIHLG